MRTYFEGNFFNDFTVTVLCVALWLRQTQSAMDFDKMLSDTVYIKNGTDTVELPCELPQVITGIQWILYCNESKEILKSYKTTTGKPLKYQNNYSDDKYGINESVYTTLVVKNITPSDTSHYICLYIGGGSSNNYTTKLQVVGKSLFAIFSAYLDKVSITKPAFLYWHTIDRQA